MKLFGTLSNGEAVYLYTISNGNVEAVITDLGATIQRLIVHGRDVVLGFDAPMDYVNSGTFFGSVVGRNANRTADGIVIINDRPFSTDRNDNGCNNLHSGYAFYKDRRWDVAEHRENMLKLTLHSPDGDQGFPGNADISVTYTLEDDSIVMEYEGFCDQDTVFNLTNHSYFNLAGHENPDKAMDQLLSINAAYFTPADELSIPTGQIRAVAASAMDFRNAKRIGDDIDCDYDALKLQHGYDHNFVLSGEDCAKLSYGDLTMEVTTDCPGVQFYSGNFLKGEIGKDGVSYAHRSGICLETQFWPDATHHPLWPQPVTMANQRYYSRTKYRFVKAD